MVSGCAQLRSEVTPVRRAHDRQRSTATVNTGAQRQTGLKSTLITLTYFTRSLHVTCLALVLGLSGLLGCNEVRDQSAQEAPDTPRAESLVLWHALRDQEQTRLLSDLKRFERETQIKVRALSLPHNAFANKLQVSIPRGNGPDLFITAHDRVGDWAEAGLIEPMSFWVDDAELNRYLKPTIEAFTYRHQLYGLPLSCKALALFYHPRLVDKPPETTDELIAIARSLNPAGESTTVDSSKDRIWGLAYPEIDSLYFHAPWLHAYGGQVIKEGQPKLNSAAMEASMSAVRKLRQERFIPPEVDGALASELFRTQKLAFLINGPWFIAELQSNKGQEWAVAPLPRLSETGAPLTPYLSVEGVVLSSRARSPKRALKLARYLASPERALRRIGHGDLVANAGLDEALDTQAPPWLKVFHRQLNSSIPLSNEPLMKSLWTPMKRALAQVIIYQADAQDALKTAQSAVVRMTRRGDDNE